MTDRERIHRLVDRVYAEVKIGNYGYDIRVCVMEGGFVPDKVRGSYRCLDMRDRDRPQEVMDYLGGLLEKDPGRVEPSGVR